ncbi:hypothetical protein ACL02R_03550 [Streptomyces sp. MS19]|uniref:hypothetical protein n=1 Tax=Streptomyces sp. MS19 TaxID=3385972 RepID=UPI0039A339D5
MKKAVGYALGVVGLGVVAYAGVELIRDPASYAAPEAMCGLTAPSSLDPLLPDGDDLEQRDAATPNAAGVVWSCQFRVDRENVLTAVVTQRTMDTTVAERYREFQPTYGFTGSETTLDDEPAVLGRNGSLVQIPCPGRGDDASLEVNVRYYAGGGDDAEEDERNVATFTEDLIQLNSDEYGCRL